MKSATKYYFHQNKVALSNRGLDQKLKQTLKNTQLIAVIVVVVSVATNVVPSVLYLG